MSRKSKVDWFIESIQILNKQGPQSLTIDALTKKLAVTKRVFLSSFWQFKTV